MRCVCCGIEIPIDDPLVSVKVATRIREMIGQLGPSKAIEELRHATGLDLIDAKYWVNHCGEPVGQGLYTGVCPFCGMELRTDIAKRCLHCQRDWHEEGGQ